MYICIHIHIYIRIYIYIYIYVYIYIYLYIERERERCMYTRPASGSPHGTVERARCIGVKIIINIIKVITKKTIHVYIYIYIYTHT